jgi:hypothetical protein
MTRTPLEKGNALEVAVRAIESVILQSSPSLRERTFVIESKKIVVVGEVRHEIDLFVTVDLGSGYRSLFIFECKNWEASVGKNEIIVFSEKIDAVQAQTGFFVAKSYTADAQAQAKKDRRIILLTATEHPTETTPVPFDFHFIVQHDLKPTIAFHQRGVVGSNKVPLDIKTAQAMLHGKSIDLDQYAKDWAVATCNDNTNTFPSGTLPEGIYGRHASSKREFGIGEFVLNDRDIDAATLEVEFTVRVIRPAVVSHFEVATRGRALSLAPVNIEGNTVNVGFVSGAP